MTPVRILMMAKEPAPGQAKTRLIPALGEEGAAALANRLLNHALQQALSANIGPVELCITPNPNNPFWQTLDHAGECEFSAQVEGDLGNRMATAARRGLSRGTPVLIIGTDCPDLSAQRLRTMAESLHTHDCCLCPVMDGGYALIGLRRFDASLFSSIPWSTEQVADITRARIESLEWSCYESECLSDVDEPQDLDRLAEYYPQLATDRA